MFGLGLGLWIDGTSGVKITGKAENLSDWVLDLSGVQEKESNYVDKNVSVMCVVKRDTFKRILHFWCER